MKPIQILPSPVVSVVIPVYKGEEYLEQSVRSCLQQTLQAIEVLIVVDASPDSSLVVARELADTDERIRVIEHDQNKGVAESFNSGFRIARGLYFTRLAQDDLWDPVALETMSRFLTANPDVGLTYANQDVIDGKGNYRMTHVTKELESALHPCNRVGLGVMWRKEVWERVGEFDSGCDFAEDYDYWLRAERYFTLRKCSDLSLLKFRNHESQNSVTGERMQLRAVERAFSKQRFHQWQDNPTNMLALVRAIRHAIRRHLI